MMQRFAILIACLLGLLLSVPGPHPAIAANSYTNSAHGDATNGVSRSSTTAYAVGNCAHCHEQHASIGGVEPLPDTGNDAGPDVYLGAGLEQGLCLSCHKAGGLNDSAGTADNIDGEISANTSMHDVTLSDTLHRANESATGMGAVGKHVECTDCHNPHTAGATSHSHASAATASHNQIAATSPIYGVTGVEPTFSTSNWLSPSGYSAVGTATKEYQICMKCHSGANTQLTTWDASWTNSALEFSSGNASAHPVVVATETLNNYKDCYDTTCSGGSLSTGQMQSPWNTNVGNQTMYCSDCHGTDDTIAAQGPHGSSVDHILIGPLTKWPYSAGTTLLVLDDVQTGTGDDIFCKNCHVIRDGSGWKNNVHENANHGSIACVSCHLLVPHGGKVSRLMAAYGSAVSNVPVRYRVSGTDPQISYFRKYTPTGYVAAGCGATACHATHNLGSGDPDAESW